MPSATLDGSQGALAGLVVHMYGGTLGSGWSGFPDRLAPDYNGGAWWEGLDVTLDVYLDWELHKTFGTCSTPCPAASNPTAISPPIRLGDQSWFQTFSSVFGVNNVLVSNPNDLYTQCLDGNGLEEPQIGSLLTVDGKLRVADINGGIGEDTRIELGIIVQHPGSYVEIWFIALRWSRPQTYTDITTGLRADPATGGVVPRPYLIGIVRGPNCQTCLYDAWTSVRMVEWPSSDVSFASPRSIDAADLAGVSDRQSEQVAYGYDVNGVPGYRNFEYNVNPFGSPGTIDSADISMISGRMGQVCVASKIGTDETTAILDWFGIGLTGRTVVLGPNEETGPEYDILDPEKNARAVADPYGYRRNIAAATARRSTWGQVKSLYR